MSTNELPPLHGDGFWEERMKTLQAQASAPDTPEVWHALWLLRDEMERWAISYARAALASAQPSAGGGNCPLCHSPYPCQHTMPRPDMQGSGSLSSCGCSSWTDGFGKHTEFKCPAHATPSEPTPAAAERTYLLNVLKCERRSGTCVMADNPDAFPAGPDQWHEACKDPVQCAARAELCQRPAAAGSAEAVAPSLQWAIDGWTSEVKHRPLVNVHRQFLDSAWRKMMRHFGGDPDALVGPPRAPLIGPRIPGQPMEPLKDSELSTRAIEELHQLGYTIRDGLLYPPEAIEAVAPLAQRLKEEDIDRIQREAPEAGYEYERAIETAFAAKNRIPLAGTSQETRG